MAKARKIQVLKVSLEPKVGSLSRVFAALKSAGVNIQASWAYQMGPDQAEGLFYPSDLAKAKGALAKLGLNPTVVNACYTEGADQVGAYAELLDKIAKARVNLEATDAFAQAGKFAAVFYVQEKDESALCKALGC